MFVLTFFDPTRVQEHHCTNPVPQIASPHVTLSLGSSQLSCLTGNKGKASQLILEAKAPGHSHSRLWDHSAMLVLTLLDPTRVQGHHCTDPVPLIASLHVVLSLGAEARALRYSAEIVGKPENDSRSKVSRTSLSHLGRGLPVARCRFPVFCLEKQKSRNAPVRTGHTRCLGTSNSRGWQEAPVARP